MRHRMLITLSILLVAGCDGQRQGGAACGIAALAGPTMLLSEFGVPGQTLSATPSQLPERLVARVAAGPAYRAVVGRADTTWVIGVEGTFEADDMPGFGVLVLDQSASRRRGHALHRRAARRGPHPGTGVGREVR